jgi:hypothetical protein
VYGQHAHNLSAIQGCSQRRMVSYTFGIQTLMYFMSSNFIIISGDPGTYPVRPYGWVLHKEHRDGSHTDIILERHLVNLFLFRTEVFGILICSLRLVQSVLNLINHRNSSASVWSTRHMRVDLDRWSSCEFYMRSVKSAYTFTLHRFPRGPL